MSEKPPAIKSGTLSGEDRPVTANELKQALKAFRVAIIEELKEQSSVVKSEAAPRPRIFHKKKEGKREKIATTIDSNLFELVKVKQQQGQQLSHILDSALWHYFGKPKMSFEDDIAD